MLRPNLLARIEKGYNIIIRKEKSGQVSAFMLITMLTGKREVAELTASAVFLTNDVLYFKSEEKVVLVEAAIFAA